MSGLFFAQALLVFIGTLVAWYFLGESSISAALYGGAIALVNTLLLSFRMDAQHQQSSDPRTTVIWLYMSAIVRFVLVLIALSVGMGVLKLNPLPLLGMFIAAQLGYIVVLSSRQGVKPT